MPYSVRKSIKPHHLKGISDEQIDQHWKLYEGYVKNANGLVEDLDQAERGSRRGRSSSGGPRSSSTA